MRSFHHFPFPPLFPGSSQPSGFMTFPVLPAFIRQEFIYFPARIFCVVRRMEEMISNLEKLGLTNRQARVLTALFHFGDVTAKELSRITGVHLTRVYGVLTELAEKGLITKLEGDPALYEKTSPAAVVDMLIQRKAKKFAGLKLELAHQVKVFEMNETETNSGLWVT